MSLLKIQQELKAPKNQYNSFGKYKYRSAEDILEAVKPLLIKHECNLTLSDKLVNIGDRYYIEATADFFNANGHTIVTAYAREEENKKGMDGSQITGTASSYARKYALNGLFLIDDTKDADASNDHGVDKDSLILKLKAKLATYTDPKKLESDKITVRDEYVKLGLDKKEATDIIVGCLNDF